MKKKVLTFLLVFALILSVVPCGIPEVHAEEEVEVEDIDYSYLEDEAALVGYMESQTWGVYLISGTSVIRKYSSTKIAAGGSTAATRACKVIVTVIVEKLVSGGWARVTSWTTTKASDVVATSSKLLTVATGYSYRVRCYHYAGTDTGYSSTDALRM